MNAIEADQVCAACYSTLKRGTGNISRLPKMLRLIIENRLWECRQVSNGTIVRLNSLAELIELPPIQGWGESVDVIENAIKHDVEALTLFRDAMLGKHGGDTRSKTNGNNVTIEQRVTGNSKAYTLSRLKKQKPDLYQQVVAGELSANAAAIAAGFRKVKTPYEVLVHAWRKASPEDRRRFLQENGGDV